MFNLVSQFASQGTYSNPPTVFVTAKHHRKGLKHDAASVWLEDVSAASFKICLRELQNFAGVHEEISVVSFIKSGGTYTYIYIYKYNIFYLELQFRIQW